MGPRREVRGWVPDEFFPNLSSLFLQIVHHIPGTVDNSEVSEDDC